jgi:phosphotransferase system enzyme I (PtsI)
MEVIKVRPAALITERGGWTSHASILAREFKLPMVSGIAPLGQVVSHGDQVIVDGINGQLIVDPDNGTLEHFRTISPVADTGANASAIGPELMTSDGVEIVLRANADSVSAYKFANACGANGIGLFRSESLLGRPGTIPVEDDQVAAYVRLADAAGDAGVRIRTFDIGLEESGHHRASTELNPSLGLRAIRLSLVETEGFRTQIRAILRASAGKNIDMILPMVSGVDEIIRSKEIIDAERDTLIKNGFELGSPRLGVMIELPSAVLTAPSIARHVDLLCLGTNDLVQYLLGVDRDNDAVAEWYQTLHPAVIASVADVLSAANEAKIPASVCGEMAGSPFYVPVLIGLGTSELSVNPNSISQVRNLIAGISAGEAAALVDEIRRLNTAREIECALREHYLKHWSHLFPPGHLNARHR